MIEKSLIKNLVNEWLEGKDYFLTDITITPDSRIVVEIDHEEGVWIDDCVELSRHIEAGLNRDEEDFELEVGSAGIGQPFKVIRQYFINVGKEVEVLSKDGVKTTGVLTEADDEGFSLSTRIKMKEEGKKRAVLTDVVLRYTYDEVKYTKHVINFK